MDAAHRALLAEIRRRLEEARDDRNVTNANGSNYWGPYVTRAIDQREADGPALVTYVQGVLRKTGDSQGWNSLFEAQRLDLSFEDMVANAVEPIRGLFNDEDREIAARLLGEQKTELARLNEGVEAAAVERDRRIVADVGERRRAAGKPWTLEMEEEMLADRAAKRRTAN